ncbi:MAG TPA: cytochrome P460 family protein [Candidatus Deferrimicrobium sp.]
MNKFGSKGYLVRIVVCIGLAVVLGAAVVPASGKSVGPAGDFRAWTHTKSMIIVDRSNGLYGFHNIYANHIALPTLKDGGNYKEGSEFACSFHELETKDGGTGQGKKIKVGFMKKDGNATNTDGWIYSALGPDGMPKEIDPVKACFECHKKAKDGDSIFSRYID